VQIAGIGTGTNAVYVRPSDDPDRFSTFCYRSGRLVAIESVGQPRTHMQARRLLSAGISIPPDCVTAKDLDLARELDAATALRPMPAGLGPREGAVPG
jgi:3-phenylpropionate/trans-cinnamate dioxygenase ferredoxin reductase subunit